MDRGRYARKRREAALLLEQLLSSESLRSGDCDRRPGDLVPGCLKRNSSRAAIREVLGLIKEGDGKDRSEAGCVGLPGALDGAVEDCVETVDAFRFEEKNFSSRSSPFAMAVMEGVLCRWLRGTSRSNELADATQQINPNQAT